MTEILVNILLSLFCLLGITALITMAFGFADDRKREKRNEEREARDAEYHLKRMNDFK